MKTVHYLAYWAGQRAGMRGEIDLDLVREVAQNRARRALSKRVYTTESARDAAHRLYAVT